jgi:hypothetical protein
MNERTIKLLFCGLAAGATVTASYAVCFAKFFEPQCVWIGDHYGQCTPLGCDRSTGLIAITPGYEWGQHNTYPSVYGSIYGGRQPSSTAHNQCIVDRCKVWNNCTQQYEESPVSGCSCNVSVPLYEPLIIACE